MRRTALILLCAGLPASVALAADGQESQRTWGFGWENGLAVRRQLSAKWEFGVSVNPWDSWWSRTRRVETSEAGDDPQVIENTYRYDGGSKWVRSFLGYQLVRAGRFAFSVNLGAVYEWGHFREDIPLSTYSESFERDRDAWYLVLGLRPAFDPVPRLTVEFDFGLVFGWRRWTAGYRFVMPDQGREAIQEERSEVFEVDYFGWDRFAPFHYTGLYGLHVILWL